MDFLNNFSAFNFALLITTLSIIFSLAWSYDVYFHGVIAKRDITDKELQVHRLILAPSVLLDFCLVLMYWIQPIYLLPLIIASYLTRTVQEFIDELNFHSNRCSFTESALHLIMWISAHAKFIATFIWGFFYQFAGVLDLPKTLITLFLISTLFQGFLAMIEWNRK